MFIAGFLAGIVSTLLWGLWAGFKKLDRITETDEIEECSHTTVVDFSSFGKPLFRCLNCGEESAINFSTTEVN